MYIFIVKLQGDCRILGPLHYVVARNVHVFQGREQGLRHELL